MYDIELEHARLRSILEETIYEIVVEKNGGKITFDEDDDNSPYFGEDMNFATMVTSIYRDGDSVNILVDTDECDCINITDLTMEELMRIYIAIK